MLGTTQTTAGQSYAFLYTYNLAGSLTSEVYRSGRLVTNSYDGMNRTVGVATGERPLVSGITYAAQGGLQTAAFANGLNRVMAYNARLQPDEITDTLTGQKGCAGSRAQYTGQAAWVLDLQLFWGASAGQTGLNNGDLQGELIQTCNGSGFSVAENYYESMSYDGVNRLATFTDNGGASNQRNFSYDAYGNMWANDSGGSTFPVSAGMPASGSVYVNGQGRTTNQRFDAGFSYDGAGNEQTAPGCTSSGCIQYDAEQRQIWYAGSGATYEYDGDGHRVEKVEAGITTVYVYDWMGDLAAEYSSAAQGTVACTTCYLSTDHLGSIRMVTDQNGKLIARHDYLPFGQEISAGYAGRPLTIAGVASPWNSADGVAQRFTGKERDSESGLDYFGARYYGSALGRWTSPDWSAKPQPVPYADLSNPQSLNLYGYVLNNPLSRVDPDGHIDCTGKNAQGVGCQYIANWNKEHGITPSAKKSNAPGVAVKLPNGKTVQDPYTHQPLMSPTADLSDVAARGKQIKSDVMLVIGYGQDLTGITGALQLKDELKTAVAQNGDFDYQRTTLAPGDLQQLPQFRDVSNFNVGLIGQQAGLSLDTLLQIVGNYAAGNSSNARPDQPYGLDPRTRDLTVLGYQTGASGAYDH